MNKTIVNQNSTTALRPFVHLHTHTEYSLSDGLSKIDALVEKAIADGMPGMAITDHANMFGVCEFVECVNRKNAEKNTNFKPIIGCEFYVARRGMEQKSEREDFAGYHLVLLAKNYTGYQNLVKLVSRSWIDGFCGRPRTDKADLERYHEGLICTSACVGGEVAQHIINDRLAEAEESAMWYKNLFGDDFYLELQRHKPTAKVAGRETYELEKKVNKELCSLSKRLDIKLVCANDAHFVNEEDAEVQDTLLCVNWKKKYDDSDRLVFSKQEWFKTTAEMNALFADIPEALDNTVEILNKVENYTISHAPILPKPALPEGVDEVEQLARLTFEGAHKRFGERLPDEVKERLKSELKVINRHSYPVYFLLWYEIVAAARKLGAQLAPGRGTTACSLVAYCLGIIEINPLEWCLPFESFLATKKRAIPPISIELDDCGREQVVGWLKVRFGADCVANIVSFNSIARHSVKEIVERVYPNYSDEQKESLLSLCQRLEGVKKGAMLHSCSLAICGEPIAERVPMAVLNNNVTGESTLATQYDGRYIETAGVVKFYILSLRHLDVVKRTIENLRTSGEDVVMENIPRNDAKTFELLCSGETLGLFQIEGKESQKELIKAQPRTFEELVECCSFLYTPRAHAICCIWLAYQSAYLKANYPTEYMRALLYTFRHNEYKYGEYLKECRRLGV
ncbi:MAG: PHP domain-containing protein [Alistipes sp.]|nr:PHP domain-containing protein [Alistipes sp.]